ncbi:MAG: hypothetical protein ABJA74_01675 [Lapillicoccus sp.]
MGRRTDEGFAASRRRGVVARARRRLAGVFNGMPKYVVSSTLSDSTWNNTMVVPDAGWSTSGG